MDAMSPKQVVGIDRNSWTKSTGIAGRHEPDYARQGGPRGAGRYCCSLSAWSRQSKEDHDDVQQTAQQKIATAETAQRA